MPVLGIRKIAKPQVRSLSLKYTVLAHAPLQPHPTYNLDPDQPPFLTSTERRRRLYPPMQIALLPLLRLGRLLTRHELVSPAQPPLLRDPQPIY